MYLVGESAFADIAEYAKLDVVKVTLIFEFFKPTLAVVYEERWIFAISSYSR